MQPLINEILVYSFLFLGIIVTSCGLPVQRSTGNWQLATANQTTNGKI